MALSKSSKVRLKTKYGEWALVTGASSGIGKALAENLADAGFNLILTARRRQVLEEIAANLQAKYAVNVQVIIADIATNEGIDHLLKSTQGLNVGLLINNAGFGTSGCFHQANLDSEVNMLQVNCTALMKLTHHFSQTFITRKKGGIILMSSMVSFQGVPYAAHYAATKAYVQSFGEALAHELRPLGVDVLSAAPGPVSSEFAQRANMQMDMTLKPSDIAVPILKALGRRSTVLPGFLTKFLVGSLRTVPRWGKVRIMKMVMGGMTKHQRAWHIHSPLCYPSSSFHSFLLSHFKNKAWPWTALLCLHFCKIYEHLLLITNLYIYENVSHA